MARMRASVLREARLLAVVGAAGALLLLGAVVLNGTVSAFSTSRADIGGSALLGQGKQVFRFDTFGDQAFWGDALTCKTRSKEPPTVASAPA